MVRLVLMCMFCGLLPAVAGVGDFFVQDRGGLPKAANELQKGQQFRCEHDCELDADGLKVFFYKGTIGFRLDTRDFFIAQGRVSVGAMPVSDPKLLIKPRPLTLRFLRGIVRSLGNDDLAIHDSGEIRWYKRKDNEGSSVIVDRRSVQVANGQLLVAAREQLHLLEEKETAFGALVLRDDMSLAKLLVQSRIVSESKPAVSTRNKVVDYFLDNSTPRRERKHALEQARRAYDF